MRALLVSLLFLVACSSDAGGLEGLDAGRELVHDAGGLEGLDAGREHDAGTNPTPATFAGKWTVTRTSQPDVRLCTDAYGNKRDPSAVETWDVGATKATGSALGVLMWRDLGQSAELVIGVTVTGSVTLTSSKTFAGSLRISGQSPTVDGSGWSTCWTTQTITATR